ncbi:TPA: hypothetical protein ACFOL8_000059 [Neisseria meningitidis]|nr:hypothetical protein [Neisseria meningitidis]
MMKKQRHILCVGCLYIILKVNVFPNTGWMEASKGMQGISFSTFGYADAPGYTFSRIVHTLIFLLGKTTGTRTTVSDSSHNVYYVKLLPKPSTKRLCRICRQANKSCFWKWRQKMPSEP